MTVQEFFERLLSVFFPPRCIFCGAVTAYDDMTCERCTVRECLEKSICGADLSWALAAAEYEPPVADAVLRLKRAPDKRIARFFGGAIAEQIKSAHLDAALDLITPVPISPAKRDKRGFNQAGLIAAEVANALKLPVAEGLLAREDASLVQHHLSAKERAENAEKSYRIAQAAVAAQKNILLIDDVWTTGATAKACGALLRNAGANSVCFAAAAHTPLKSTHYNPT